MQTSDRQSLRYTSAVRMVLALVALFVVAACQPIQPEAGAVPDPAQPATGPVVGEENTMWIGPQTQTCMGVVEQQCMQVRWSEDGEWQNFYGGIDGFVYVPGYNYELVVMVTEIENPPADGSSLMYSLVSVTSRTPDWEGEPLPLTGTNWQLIHFGDEAMVPFDPTQVTVTALFGDDLTLSGSAGCNRYNGTYALEGDEFMAISELATTRMMCGEAEMVVEAAFLQALPGHHQYQVNGDKLEIVWAAGQLIFQGTPGE